MLTSGVTVTPDDRIMGVFSFLVLCHSKRFVPRAGALFTTRETTERQVDQGAALSPQHRAACHPEGSPKAPSPRHLRVASAPTLHSFLGSHVLCSYYFNKSPKQSCMGSAVIPLFGCGELARIKCMA